MLHITKYLAASILLISLAMPVFAGPATEATSKLKQGFEPIFGSQDKSLGEIIAQIIEYVLSFLGVIFVVLMIYAGFNWMTAAGDSDKVSSAKETMISATIGLAIILSSYTLTYFILKNLTKATGNY